MSMELLDKSGLAYFWTKIKAYVAGLLSSKADDSDVVHIAGTETISGAKTFSSPVTAPRFDGAVSMYDLDAPTTDSSAGAVPVGFFSLIDAARSCKSAFLPASSIIVEYSIDGGTTWLDYGATDEAKRQLFAMTRGFNFSLGKGTSGGSSAINTNCKLRVTAIAYPERYALVNTLYVYLSAFNHTVNVDIERSTIGTPETFSTLRRGVRVSGWAGPNVISFGPTTFGGHSNQSSNAYALRFTFYCTVIGSSTGYPWVGDIRLFGSTTWVSANNMMYGDHLYSWDYEQNAIFPANVTANTFIGALTGNASTASAIAWSGVTSKPTTISGYGITDAGISSGTITLGSNTITPLTEDSVKFASSASRSADIAADGTFTVPSYTVGKGQLLVYLDGCLSREGDGWDEVGTAGDASTTIKFNQLIPMDMEISVRVN